MNARNWLATGLFVLSYPGFFVYHYAAGVHLIPMFAGGLASWVNILGTIVLAPFFLFDVVKERSWRIHMPVMALFAIFVLYSVYYKFAGSGHAASNEAFVYNMKMLFGLLNLYFIGYYFRGGREDIAIVFMCFIVLSILTFSGTYFSTLSFIMGEVKLENGDVTSSYQGFSTAYTIVCVTLLAMITNIRLVYFVVYLGTVCVFLLVSRSELLGYFAVVSMLALIHISSRRIKAAFLIESGMIALIVAMLLAPRLSEYTFVAAQAIVHGIQWLIYKIQLGYDYIVSQTISLINNIADQLNELFNPPEPAEQLTESDQVTRAPQRAAPEPIDLTSPGKKPVLEGNFRQQEILDLAKSESLRQRMLTFSFGWAGIMQSPFWGDYAGQIRDFNNPGMYMHNALSVWQQFGIISFLIYIFVSARAFFVSGVKVVLKNANDNPSWRLVLLVSVYAFSLVIVSKSIYWPVPAFAWGLYAARVSARHLEKSI